jgi:hypothetical protein
MSTVHLTAGTGTGSTIAGAGGITGAQRQRPAADKRQPDRAHVLRINNSSMGGVNILGTLNLDHRPCNARWRCKRPERHRYP